MFKLIFCPNDSCKLDFSNCAISLRQFFQFIQIFSVYFPEIAKSILLSTSLLQNFSYEFLQIFTFLSPNNFDENFNFTSFIQNAHNCQSDNSLNGSEIRNFIVNGTKKGVKFNWDIVFGNESAIFKEFQSFQSSNLC
jgi:hypothetical protein